MTWRNLLNEAEEQLKRAGVVEYRTDAWYLFSEAFSVGRAEFFLRRDEKMKESPGVDDKINTFRGMISRRACRIPLQQITGHQEFMGIDFLISEDVLIPRQDTEVLVETALSDLKKRGEAQKKEERPNRPEQSGELRILDLCTGSGCIAISLERLSEVPVSVLGSDISEKALRTAEMNADRLNCEHCDFCRSDLFEQISGKFDLIVSNPPYIPSAVIDTLEEEVRLHEPRIALDGSSDGLLFYRKIASEALNHLNPDGGICLEIGFDQAYAVRKILQVSGFSGIQVIKDLAGHDRVVTAVRKENEKGLA